MPSDEQLLREQLEAAVHALEALRHDYEALAANYAATMDAFYTLQHDHGNMAIWYRQALEDRERLRRRLAEALHQLET
jgi:predicted nuclease with TOPRIM domain